MPLDDPEIDDSEEGAERRLAGADLDQAHGELDSLVESAGDDEGAYWGGSGDGEMWDDGEEESNRPDVEGMSDDHPEEGDYDELDDEEDYFED